MRSFEEIFAISADRHGGVAALEAKLAPPKGPAELASIPDDRWLAMASRFVFSAGFNWKVIENKWPGFEDAFFGFELSRCAFMNEEWFEDLVQDKRIVRHAAKIRSVQDNAIFMQSLTKEHGSVGAFFANWPASDFTGLLARMKKDGTRLGGSTGQYFLRFMGCDAFILSKDVVARLVAEGVVDKAPTSKGAMAKTQAAFDVWAGQSGRSLTEISRVLAFSTG